MALSHLIQSMTASEKRFFKLHSNFMGAKAKQTHRLFDLINKGIQEDAVLKAKLNTSAYHNYKKKLYKELLKSLIAYQKKNNPYINYLDTLAEAEILIQKGLWTQAYKRLDISVNHLDYHQQILFLKNKHLVLQYIYEHTKGTNKILHTKTLKELIACTKYMNQLGDYIKMASFYDYLNAQIVQIINSRSSRQAVQQDIQKLLHQLLEQSYPVAQLPKDLQEHYFYNLCQLHFYLGNHTEVVRLVIEELGIAQLEYLQSRKYHIIDIYLGALIRLHKPSAFMDYYNRLGLNNTDLSPQNCNNIFRIYARYLELIARTDFKHWSSEEVHSIATFGKQHQKNIDLDLFNNTNYRLAEVYFQQGAYDKIINSNFLQAFVQKKGKLQYHTIRAYFLLILAYLEQRNLSLAKHFQRSLRHRLDSSKSHIAAEIKTLYNWLTRLIRNIADKEKCKALFHQLYDYTQNTREIVLNSKVLERYAAKKLQASA